MPAVAHPAELTTIPILGLLLYATFLSVPFAKIGQAFRDWRFLSTVLVVNFVLVPIVVFLLSRIVAHDQVLLVGVLFVLLTPCVDYVIVFTGIAGGAKERLLAAAPLLMQHSHSHDKKISEPSCMCLVWLTRTLAKTSASVDALCEAGVLGMLSGLVGASCRRTDAAGASAPETRNQGGARDPEQHHGARAERRQTRGVGCVGVDQRGG